MLRIDYNYILDINKLIDVYKIIKRNTKNKDKLVNYELNLSTKLNKLLSILKGNLYNHGAYNIFTIYEPKIRLIMSEKMDDKIINHLISKYVLNELIEPILIDSNVATRCNKGSGYADKLLVKYLRRCKLKYNNFYLLKCDIKKFFYNIDHNILKDNLRNIIKDNSLYNLICNIIDSTNNTNKYVKGKGLPIGNMSSQILAIYYLNKIDHLIKEKLHIKYYVRYMDDFILINESKEYLYYCLNIIKSNLKAIKLELNNKTCIVNMRHGFTFLGYKYLFNGNKLIIKIKNKTKYRIRKRLNGNLCNICNYNGYLKFINVKFNYKKRK